MMVFAELPLTLYALHYCYKISNIQMEEISDVCNLDTIII